MDAAWCPNDKRSCVVATTGQITPSSQAGRLIIETLKTHSPNFVLDIGTWNGLGSTLCCLMGLQGNTTSRLLSVESNREKNEIAKKNCAPFLTVNLSAKLLWGTLLQESDMADIDTVFPQLSDPEFKRWHTIDVANMNQAPYLLDLVPEAIDFALFDGGEFTTYYEFKKLFSRCTKFIALDDTNTAKCALIRSQLQADPLWNEVAYLPERNGFSLFRHI